MVCVLADLFRIHGHISLGPVIPVGLTPSFGYFYAPRHLQLPLPWPWGGFRSTIPLDFYTLFWAYARTHIYRHTIDPPSTFSFVVISMDGRLSRQYFGSLSFWLDGKYTNLVWFISALVGKFFQGFSPIQRPPLIIYSIQTFRYKSAIQGLKKDR